jgi:hypothetical protein
MNLLAKKLFLKPGQRWFFYNVPADCEALLYPLTADLTISHAPTGQIDGILFFSTKRAELIRQLDIVSPLIKNDNVAWVCYPKKSSGMETDLAMGAWDMLETYHLDAVANAAFNEVWTCVRLRPAGLRKKSGVGADEIKENEYGRYINVNNKKIILPPEIAEVLNGNPIAMNNYQALSYTNRKEYVMWILTAKQEKTKAERLLKMVEKLEAGKKNPGEK